MSRCVIFHSYSGVTRLLAQKIKDACGADLIEVMPKRSYNAVTVYVVGGYRAMKDALDPIEQKKIDVTGYDLVILATPVWAGKPTPVMNAAISALKGYEKKKVVLVATCKSQPGNVFESMRTKCANLGLMVIRTFFFTDSDLKDGKKLNELIVAINASLTE
jgi:flavodoxin